MNTRTWVVVLIAGAVPDALMAQGGLAIESFSIKSNSAAGPKDADMSFSVVNSSDKPILGYSLGVEFTSRDGKTGIWAYPQDFMVTSPETVPDGVSIRDAKPTGPLQPGKRQKRRNLGYNISEPMDLKTVMLFVVFEDNSVLGDIERAKREFFKPHEVICAEYQWYLGELRRALSSPDGGQGAINRLRENFMMASSETKYPVLFSKIQLSYDELLDVRQSVGYIYPRIWHELEDAKQQLERRSSSPVFIVSECIKSAEAQLARYSKHLRPRY